MLPRAGALWCGGLKQQDDVTDVFESQKHDACGSTILMPPPYRREHAFEAVDDGR